ncbi:hypothetical protein [Caudoviricetes sp.]|nr:hypothetical protein [Caudoviricetes sp.]
MILGEAALGEVALGEEVAASSGFSLSLNKGSLVFTSLPTSLNAKRNINTTLSSVVFTPKTTNISFGSDFNLSLNLASITFTSKPTSLNKKLQLTTNPASILFTKKNTNLNIKRNLSTNLASVVFTSKATNISFGAHHYLSLNLAHITLTSKQTSLNAKRNINTFLASLNFVSKTTTITLGAEEEEVETSATTVTIPVRHVTNYYSRKGRQMALIQNLPQVSTVSLSDMVPLKQSTSSAAVVASLNTIKGLLTAEITSADDKITQVSSPQATGFTVTINDSSDSIWLVLTPAAGYAAGTITLPAVANCVDKQEILVNCTQAVTTLTVNGNGATAVLGAPTTLAANAFFRLRFEAVMDTWYRVG